MSDFKLMLPDDSNMSPEQYVKTRLIPLAGELNRLCAEFFRPGSTSEATAVDMTVADPHRYFEDVDRRYEADKPKSVRFGFPQDMPTYKDNKKLRIVLSAVVYCLPEGTVCFQLVRSRDHMVIKDSSILIKSNKPILVERVVQFGQEAGQVCWMEEEYHLQAKFVGVKCQPIVRRFALNCVYLEGVQDVRQQVSG